MKWTWNSRLKPMTLTSDLDLVLAWLTYGFCTLTHWGEHLTKVLWKPFKGFRRYGADRKCYRRTDGDTDGCTDGQTKAISIIPHLLRGGGLTKGDNSKSKEGRVVSLVRNKSSCPILLFYKVPSKYSEGCSSYRTDKKSISNKTKGDSSKSKKARIVFLVCDMSSGPVLHFYQVS